jgi:molecular chaperone DnaJ
MERSGRSHYDVLGVPQGASGEEIRRAFRALALRYHPDVCGGHDAGSRFREISDAYVVLHDPVARARYDRSAPRESRAARAASGVGDWRAVRGRGDDVPRFLDEEPQVWKVIIQIRGWLRT